MSAPFPVELRFRPCVSTQRSDKHTVCRSAAPRGFYPPSSPLVAPTAGADVCWATFVGSYKNTAIYFEVQIPRVPLSGTKFSSRSKPKSFLGKTRDFQRSNARSRTRITSTNHCRRSSSSRIEANSSRSCRSTSPSVRRDFGRHSAAYPSSSNSCIPTSCRWTSFQFLLAGHESRATHPSCGRSFPLGGIAAGGDRK